MGGVESLGILRCAQDDGKNRQRQKQQDNGKNKREATATAKYRDLSTARRTMMLSVASVEMTFFFGVQGRRLGCAERSIGGSSGECGLGVEDGGWGDLGEDLEDGAGVGAHVVAGCKAGQGAAAHGGLLGGGEGEPLGEGGEGAAGVVGGGEAGAVGDDLLPDVDLVGDEDGLGAGQRLGDGDAEVLLVRGQGEDLRGAEGSPLLLALEHGEEMDTVGEAGSLGLTGEAGFELEGVGTGEDEVEVGMLGGDLAEGVEQEVAALLGVNAAEEEDEGLGGAVGVAQSGMVVEEGGAELGGVCRGRGWRRRGRRADSSGGARSFAWRAGTRLRR